jgi:hypothetical protein
MNDLSLATPTDYLPISALRLESGRRICTFVLKLFTMQVPHLINLLHSEMTAWRQDLHAHPELGFEEHRTNNVNFGLVAPLCQRGRYGAWASPDASSGAKSTS